MSGPDKSRAGAGTGDSMGGPGPPVPALAEQSDAFYQSM